MNLKATEIPQQAEVFPDDDTWKSTLPWVEQDVGQRDEDKLPRACTLLHQIVIEKYLIPIRSNNSV